MIEVLAGKDMYDEGHTRADWLALGEIHSDQARVRAWILLRNSNSRHFYLELLTNTYISVRSLWDLVCKLLNICSSSTKRGKAGNSKWSLANILHCITASKTD